MFRRKNNEYHQLQEQLKAALEAETPIEGLQPHLYYFLEERLTGSFIVLGVVAVIALVLFLLDEQASVRILLFAALWKGIDAWGRPYFHPFIAYRIKKLFP